MKVSRSGLDLNIILMEYSHENYDCKVIEFLPQVFTKSVELSLVVVFTEVGFSK